MNNENIVIIVAKNKNRVIGKNGQLPWTIKSDLRFYKDITTGHQILLGRKTFESIGKALPGRTNIVLTKNILNLSNSHIFDPGIEIRTSLESALKEFSSKGIVFVSGGQQIYEESIKYASKIISTNIQNNNKGDSYFPKIDRKEWKINKKIENFWQTPEEFITEPNYTITEWIRK